MGKERALGMPMRHAHQTCKGRTWTLRERLSRRLGANGKKCKVLRLKQVAPLRRGAHKWTCLQGHACTRFGVESKTQHRLVGLGLPIWMGSHLRKVEVGGRVWECQALGFRQMDSGLHREVMKRNSSAHLTRRTGLI